MSSHLNPESVVLEYIERFRRHDESEFELVAPDFVQHAATPQGRDGIRHSAQVINHDLGRPEVQVLHVVASGDLVVVHLLLLGKHQASTMPLLQGVAVTGLEISWTFMHLLRVDKGLIVEHWSCRDDVGLLAQLGAWPPA